MRSYSKKFGLISSENPEEVVSGLGTVEYLVGVMVFLRGNSCCANYSLTGLARRSAI